MKLVDAAQRAFRLHDGFGPRYGWFRKAFTAADRDPYVYFAEDRPVRLGVGINMVNAIRTWGLAAKILSEGQRQPTTPRRVLPTRFGHKLLGERGWDRFVEDLSSLWLLHWRMMSPKCTIPAWWLAFNELGNTEFSKDELELAVNKKLADTPWKRPSPRTIRIDLGTMLLTYAPPLTSKDRWTLSFEELLESPLRCLQLIKHSDTRGFYRFNLGQKFGLPSEIVAHASLDFASRSPLAGNSISVNRLATEPGAPGRVFKVTESEILLSLEQQACKWPDLELAENGDDHTLSWSDAPGRTAELILNDNYANRAPGVETWLALPSTSSITFDLGCQSAPSIGGNLRATNAISGDLPGQTLTSSAVASQSHTGYDNAGRDSNRLATGLNQPELQALLTLLEDVRPLQPAIAARHSAEHDLIRVFSFDYALGGDPVPELNPASKYDGKVLLMVGHQSEPPPLCQCTPAGKPTLAVIPDDLSTLLAPASKVTQLTEACRSQPHNRDFAKRLDDARAALRSAADEAFSPANCRWVLLSHVGDGSEGLSVKSTGPHGHDTQTGEPLNGRNGNLELPARPRSETISQVADIAYPCTPEMRNEMLNRWPGLTTQGTSTRTKLLNAMVEQHDKKDLGFDSTGKKYPQKLAMYRSVLHQTGLHRYDRRRGAMAFGKPTEPSLRPAWHIVDSEAAAHTQRRLPLKQLHTLLLSPPVGMRMAAVPVFLTAWMLSLEDRLRVFKDDREVPLSGATVQCMSEHPELFSLEVKHPN